MDQIDIHHGHLINDDHIRFQRIVFVPLKSGIAFRATGDLKHPVDRACLISGHFTHPLGCAPGWCREENIHSFQFKIFDDRVDRCGLSGTRTTRDHQKSTAHCLLHRIQLLFIQRHSCLLFNPADPVLYLLIRHIILHVQVFQQNGTVVFHIIIGCRIDLHLPVFFFQHQFPLDRQIHVMFFDQCAIHAKQVTRPSGQFGFRQIGMSVHRCLKQCIQNTTAHAEI